jgi:predicted RNase H-like nuclease (RuvC/YqgF family)
LSPGLKFKETITSERETTHDISEIDGLRTKLQEKDKKIENLQKILEELQEVSQLNEELWMMEVRIF